MAGGIMTDNTINNLDNHTGFYLQPFTDRLEVRYLVKGRAVSFIMLKWEDFEAMRQKATDISPVIEIPNAFYDEPHNG